MYLLYQSKKAQLSGLWEHELHTADNAWSRHGSRSLPLYLDASSVDGSQASMLVRTASRPLAYVQTGFAALSTGRHPRFNEEGNLP